jgi:uncharacterized protein (DUF2249 family)
MNMPPLNAFQRLDVRPLIAAGEEPFPQIRKRVDALGAGEGLLVIAPFLPSPLIEKLSHDGFAAKVQHGTGGEWMVYFWRQAL